MEAGRERASTGTAPAEAVSLRFRGVAHTLAQAAVAEGLVAPAFRSPPRTVGLSRALTRGRDGHVTVSVLLRGRPWPAVLADMVEGVVVTNGLGGVEADRCRRLLWGALDREQQRRRRPAPARHLSVVARRGRVA